MPILAKSFIVVVFATLAVPALTQKFLAVSPGDVSRDRVAEKLRSLLGHGQQQERMASIEDTLRPTFMALPRDSRGSLEHRVARYALHRYFLAEYGWHIKGLSLEAGETNTSHPAAMLKSGMPSFIIDVLEDQIGTGRLGLEKLAVLVATVEDLVRGDAVDLLELAYNTHNFSTHEPLDEKEADVLIRTLALYFLLPSSLKYSHHLPTIKQFVEQAPRSYPGWEDTMVWVEDVRQGLEYQDRSVLRPFTSVAGHQWDFTSMAHWATSVSAGFGKFTNIECKEMQSKLLDMEDEERQDGRVGLSKFYVQYLETGHIHFSESPAYLRHLGALDEQNPRRPSVILPNLLYAKSNCLATSGFYSVCCIDACEALMSGLEQEISEPLAAPALIAAVVSVMPSDTVAAPRNLSAPLRSRLEEIAGRHGGGVPLHSRLFAQWMHYAYPNECPHPRSLLASEPELTAQEWEAKTESSALASREEMRASMDLADRGQEEQVASDGPAVLWSEDEELLGDVLSVPQHDAMFSALRLIAGVLALAASAVSMYEAVLGEPSEKDGKPNKQAWLGGVSASIARPTHQV